MTIELGGASLQEGAMDGLTLLEVYVGSQKIWPTVKEVVQITLGAGWEARDQLRAALADRGMSHQTVTEIPFDIELIGSGSAEYMFDGCAALTTAPEMGTSQVTSTYGMFRDCAALTHVPDMDTSLAKSMAFMFRNCSSLTDGNVRLIGRHPNANTTDMIRNSGLTREPFYTADGKPIDVYEVALTDVSGNYDEHPLVTVTVPAGESWHVRIQGTVTKANNSPYFMIGTTETGTYAQGATVDITGTVTSTNPKIVMVTKRGHDTSFTGTVTITRSI